MIKFDETIKATILETWPEQLLFLMSNYTDEQVIAEYKSKGGSEDLTVETGPILWFKNGREDYYPSPNHYLLWHDNGWKWRVITKEEFYSWISINNA